MKEGEVFTNMKLSKDELLTKVKDVFDGSTDEKYISLLEDISDSLEDHTEELTQQVETLTSQVEELKQKYIDRFFTATEEPAEVVEEQAEEPAEEEETEIEDLFEDQKED